MLASGAEGADSTSPEARPAARRRRSKDKERPIREPNDEPTGEPDHRPEAGRPSVAQLPASTAAATRAGLADRVVPLALILFAFAWCRHVGARGFFALDQSIALDGAWRVYQGQVPFVDFWTPHGLPLLGALSLAFRVFGPGYDTYLGFACVENALGAWLVWSIIRRLGGGRAVSALASVVTAVWFQAPHGTPYSEQTAFLLALGSWLCLVRGGDSGWRLPLLAGVLASCAFITKQNAGALSLLVCGLLLYVAPRADLHKTGSHVAGASRAVRSAMQDAAAFGIGFALPALGLLLWLVFFSDPARFLESYFVIPSGLILPRLTREFPKILMWPFVGIGHLALPAATLIACFPPVRAWRRATGDRPALRRIALLCIALHFHQTLFTILTRNHPENGYPFGGLILALSLMTVPWAFDHKRLRRLGTIIGVFLLVWALARGLRVSGVRAVHRPVLKNGTYEESLDVDGWRALRWGNPTLYEKQSLELAQLEGVIEHLEARGGNFFVFPEHTFLYALLGRVSPQPLLWFHAGVTYPKAYDEDLDRRVVADLERHDVRTVVFEERAFLPAEEHLQSFPLLRRFLADEFHETARHGWFVLLERAEVHFFPDVR